ncbi:MAG: alpha/beta hydrolase [Phenylobacterium sp. RIFCSPHIGHO2_01_FULL_69_31]|jgi:pimeloyl-ACP methyl ester carboxylesterase|uniref:alpha/beta fold hydrolase n=1 Tax=Phenylobacterium sp. RIFCSPHIGHO2_01_FULL_69_31 TaxID=1801944 RepID=UPI0008CD0C6F|nr:alpha/beta fold hydrolase [Phenylobacterium sp. RIFCSPHIGHO2_01_FULL_69_31]OHB31359.1 MAG: alpha/beta hydrolase [Phenylobacterium sp. RIFCSPHIGHO2_01_FULL_69_31]
MGRLLRIAAVLLAGAWLAGCVAPDIPYPRLEAKYANAASRYASLPGGLRVHYRDEGPRDARTIVLVHGFAASLHAWEPWVERLKHDYRVVSLDLPGHGLTRAPDDYAPSSASNAEIIDTLTRQLGVERFVLAGNSMGGAVAWSYAMAHPGRLDGLVLVNAAGWPSSADAGGGPAIFKLLANPVGRLLLRNIDPRPLAARGLKQAYVDERLVNDPLLDRYVELARAPGHRALLTRRGARPAVAPETFARIQAPTLVMVGLRDEVIPPERSAAFAKVIPGSKLVTYAAGGHVPMEQMPDASARDLRAFLTALPSRNRPAH